VGEGEKELLCLHGEGKAGRREWSAYSVRHARRGQENGERVFGLNQRGVDGKDGKSRINSRGHRMRDWGGYVERGRSTGKKGGGNCVPLENRQLGRGGGGNNSPGNSGLGQGKTKFSRGIVG